MASKVEAKAYRSGAVDPETRLTPAEKVLIDRLNKYSREEILALLKTSLQVAMEIELATIPIYLYTYYSIDRTRTTGESITPAQVYANRAAAILMSVAVEEMLHMSLVGNIIYAMGWQPHLRQRAPAAYPTGLPYHRPVGPPGPGGRTAVKIPLARLSFGQLWHFLQIEYPEKWNEEPKVRDWTTIGQFYSYLRCLMRTDALTDADFQRAPAAQAIQPYNYSPNCTDSQYPTGKFDPWKPAPPAPMPGWAEADGYPAAAAVVRHANRDDSHTGKSQLLCIASRDDALLAIDTICDQGEGYPVPNMGGGDYDDPSHREESHYVKFLTLQAQFAEYVGTLETLPAFPPPPLPQLPTITQQALEAEALVYPYPDNPTTASYPEGYRPLSDFCNACFEYMLLMTETIYRVPPHEQRRFFNEALHRSMLWVLDSLIHEMSEIVLPGGSRMAPTFERYDLGDATGAFGRLTDVGRKALAALPPKLSPKLRHSLSSIVATATTAKSGGHAMHLPDVARYWARCED